jgi:hypothetical protein
MALLTLVVGRAAAGETPAPTGGDGLTVVELTKQMTITAVYLQSWLLPGLLCAALYLVLSWRWAGSRVASSDSWHPCPHE